MQEVPRRHRFDYGGRCWWCGAVANSREHKHKKTDMTREFGPGPYVGDSGVVRGFEETLRPVQGPGSDELKFARVLCATCNNVRSQPFDMAYDTFTTFVINNEDSIIRARRFRFSDVYGGAWRSARENVAKYYVKHVGCRLAQAGIKVEQPILDYLDGRSKVLAGLEMTFEIRTDIVALMEHLRLHSEDFGGMLWMGDLYCTYSPSAGTVDEVQGFLGYRWLRLNYFYDMRILHPRSSFRRNKVKLQQGASVDLSRAEDECEECKADRN
jgi:hypothetical protein